MTDLRTPDKRIDPKLIQRFFFTLDFALLITHLMLQFVYYGIGSTVLFSMNILSLATYLFLIIVLKNKQYPIFVLVVYIEVLFHAIIATLVTGWPANFQLWLIALTCSYFFPSLVFEKKIDTERISFVFAIISAIAYFAVLAYSHYGKIWPIMLFLPADACFALTVMNSIIAFIVVIMFSSNFAKGLLGSNKKLSVYANFDQLTGLYNRYGIQAIITDVYHDFQDLEYSVAIFDIDNFKSINDIYGHVAGDVALKAIGEELLGMIGGDKLFCRWGGDEFTVIVIGGNHEERITDCLEMLRKRVMNMELKANGESFNITISCGIAYHRAGETRNQSFYRADKVLYEAKARGKNQIVIDEG